MHKFMKMAGCNTEEEFYQKYPSEKAFFAAYPHMKGNQTMKNGGAASGHPGSYWNGDTWVSTEGDSGTYSNGVYYQQGGNYDAYIPTPGSVSTGKDISLRPYVTLMTYPGDTLTNNQIPYATRSAYDYGTSVYPGGIGLRGKQSPLRYKPSEKDIQKMIQYENQMNLLEKAKSKMGYYGTDEMPAPYKLNGGPVFMPGGSAPIFGMGGSASFNISNNDYPSPFAMAPGTGMGSGYLQDLPTHMAHGGHIPGADIIDPFAMYPGTGSGGGMLQDLPTEMKKGGIHIAPSKRGTFTAAATKHGKSVQAFASQVLANKENYSPAMVKKANFARNASKWKHEYGGSTMMEDGGTTMPDNPGFRALPSAVQQKIMDNMQTGGMVTDDRMIYGPGGQYMQTGGMINPYHPMAKFLRGGYYQGGGMFGPDGRNAEDETEVPAYTSPTTVSNPSDDPNIAANTGVVQQNPDPADNAAWRQGMTKKQAQENIKYGKNSVQAYDPLTGDTTDNQYNKVERQNRNAARNQKWQNVSNWGNAILGTGMTALGIGRAYKNKRDAENSRNKQFNDGSSANKLFAMNQPGDKGDYTQQGIFRPDSMTPTAAGKFYPGMAGSYNQGMGITKYGGGVMNNYTYAHGGYHAGQEVELSDAEIANLKRMGYQFDIL